MHLELRNEQKQQINQPSQQINLPLASLETLKAKWAFTCKNLFS